MPRKQSEAPGPDVPKTASKLNVLNEEQQVPSLSKPDQDTLAEIAVCVLCFVKTLDSCCVGAKRLHHHPGPSCGRGGGVITCFWGENHREV